MTLEQRVASRVKERRDELGISQADLAVIALVAGAPWTQPKIAAVETGRRQLALGEALLLANILGIGLDHLLAGESPDEKVNVGGIDVNEGQLRRMIRGEWVLTLNPAYREPTRAADITPEESLELWNNYMGVIIAGHQRLLRRAARRYGLADSKEQRDEIDAVAHSPAEQHLSKRLGVSALEIAAASIATWGRRIIDERDERRAAQQRTKRDVTSELIDELSAAINARR